MLFVNQHYHRGIVFFGLLGFQQLSLLLNYLLLFTSPPKVARPSSSILNLSELEVLKTKSPFISVLPLNANISVTGDAPLLKNCISPMPLPSDALSALNTILNLLSVSPSASKFKYDTVPELFCIVTSPAKVAFWSEPIVSATVAEPPDGVVANFSTPSSLLWYLHH